MARMLCLASACLLMVMTTTAFSETQAEQQACVNDAFNVCWSAIPDRQAVFACLMKNKNKVSGACRQVLSKYSRPHLDKVSSVGRYR